MKSSPYLKLAAFCLAIGIFLLVGCKVEKIEASLADPVFSLRNNLDCNFYYSGIVLDANNMTPIADATVELEEYDLQTTTDIEGKFMLTLKVTEDVYGFFEEQKLIKVSKDGFVINTLELDFRNCFTPADCGNNNRIKIDGEVLLTPRSTESYRLNPEGGDLWLKDTIASAMDRSAQPSVNEYMFWFMDKEVTEETKVTVTPLNINQSMGTTNEPAGIVFRFEALPAGMVFEKGVMLNFKTHRTDLPLGTIYEHYTLNEATNRWEKDETSSFEFKRFGTIVLTFYKFAPYHLITARPNIQIELDTLSTRVLTAARLLNCDCGDPEVFRKDFSFDELVDEVFTYENKMDEMSTRIMIADIRNMMNLPAYASDRTLRMREEANKTIAEVMHKEEMTMEGTTDKCSIKTIFAREKIRFISGTINNTPFEYQTTIAINCGEEVLRCPTSSDCHQGCSN